MSIVPRCIVSDFDRTLTGADLVFDVAARERIQVLRAAGIRFIIATGRRHEELQAMGLLAEVDGLVAENGAIIALPDASAAQVLHPEFAKRAREALGELATRFAWGLVVGSGPRELAAVASEGLTRAGVPHAMEFNAEEVMLLPAGVNKASGAQLCLARLGLTAQDAWAIGDGENDATMLRWAKVGAAPSNAAQAARDAADIILTGAYAKGFMELTAPLVAADAPRTQ